jgi:hypothetical protein
VLEDGVILKSQAHLIASTTAPVSPAVLSLQQALVTALSGARDAADAVER